MVFAVICPKYKKMLKWKRQSKRGNEIEIQLVSFSWIFYFLFIFKWKSHFIISPSSFSFLFLPLSLYYTLITHKSDLYEAILLSPFLRVSCSCMKQPLFHPIPIDPWNLWTEYRFMLQKWFQNCWTIYTKSMLCLFLTQLVYIHYLIIF